MSDSYKQLWLTLSTAGLVDGSVPEPGELESPWYVTVMMAFFGWLVAFFLLGFVGFGLFSALENSYASFLVGGFMVGGAFMLLRAPKNAFLEHFSLAISLAGQVLVIWGMFDAINSKPAVLWFSIMVFQALLAVFMPGAVHRVFSSFATCFALSTALILVGIPYLASGVILLGAALLWLNEFRLPTVMQKIRSIGIGLVLAVIGIKSALFFSYNNLFWLGYGRHTEIMMAPWVGELLTGFVFLFVVWQLLQRLSHQLSIKLRIAALISALIIAAVSFETPGIIIGIVILLLGSAGSHRVLIGLGIAVLLFYISAYYYFLDTTLLMKALTLMVLGLVLLSSRWLMHHFLPSDNAGEDSPAQRAQHAK